MTAAEQQKKENERNLDATLRKLRSRIVDEMSRTEYFTGTLSVSVQNGVLRTSKFAIEDCEHFCSKT